MSEQRVLAVIIYVTDVLLLHSPLGRRARREILVKISQFRLNLFWVNPNSGFLGLPADIPADSLKSTHSVSYQRMLGLLIEARKTAGLTQHDVAARLNRPQSFVSKIEQGERRLDVIEFLELCRLIGADPHKMLRTIAAGL